MKAEKISMVMLVLKKMILNNRLITIREVADHVGISFGTLQAIFTNFLGMKLEALKIVSKLLKQRRMDIAQEMFTKCNDAPDLLKKVITGNESWVHYLLFFPKRKAPMKGKCSAMI